MSSLKMTFSLTSLILIFALAAIPAMAHDLDTDTEGLQHAASNGPALTQAEHDAQHLAAPTVKSIELVNVMARAANSSAATDPASSTVNGSSVVLVADANVASPGTTTLTDLTATDAGQFKVKVTFDQDVYNDRAGATFAADDLVADDFTITAATQADSSTNVFTSSGVQIDSAAGVARMAKAGATPPFEGAVFLVTFSVPASHFGGDSGETADLPIDIWVSVNADKLFTKSGLVDGVDFFGTGNTAGAGVDDMDMPIARQKFTIVKTLPDAPDVKVTIAPADVVKSVTEGMGEIAPSGVTAVDFTLTPATAIKPMVTVKVNDKDVDIDTGYSVSGVGMDWNLKVAVNAVTQKIEVMAASGFALQQDVDGDGMLTDIDKFTVEVDDDGPTVKTITAPLGIPAAGGAFAVTIEFDEPLAVDAMPTFTVTNGSLSDIRLVSPAVYSATVTPDAGVVKTNTDTMKQSVEIRLKAGVMDEHGNASMATAATATADGSFMPEMATIVDDPDTPETPPVVDTDNKLTNLSVPAESYVLLVHNEASQGLPILPSNAQKMTWAGMPNLETLLYSGGSITLTRAAEPKLDHDNDDPDANGKKADGTTDSTAARDAGARDLIITEVMWARNLAKRGVASETGHQWIEIYNPLKVPVSGVTVTTKAGRPELPAPSGMVLLDRLSNVVGGGWQLTGFGQDGYDDGNPETASTDFISMYRKERGKDGDNKGHWAQSTEVYLALHKGTPGALERAGTKVLTTTTIPRSPVIFNEIANRGAGNTAYEWIELRNVSDAEANLKNWQISIVTAVDSDKEFFNFYDKDIKIPAGGVLLLVTSDPSENDDHPLAAGYNIEKGADNQANGVNATDSPRYLIMKKSENDDNDKRGLKSTYADGEGLPNNGEFVLILRNGLDKEGKAEKLIDIAGYDTDLSVNTDALFTGLWPLVNYPKPDIALNKLEADKVHRRQKADIDGTRTADKKDNADHVAFRDVGWTGTGYKRNASPSNANGGTPGYDNGVVKSDGADAISAVRISEIMFDASRNYPQWIELHNTSKMHGVNIDNWSIFIVNHNNNADGTEYAGKLTERVDLDGKIPPGQTYLIVARRGADETQLPPARIHSASKKRSETMLNAYAFQVTLKAKTNEGDANKHQTVDMVGNLAAKPATSRRADAQSFLDPVWMLPAGTNDEGHRESIVRVPGVEKGMSKAAWKPFDMTEGQISQGTYYGHSNDIGNPGYTQGGVLPVSLSKFRPERLKDTGEIVVRWVTQSELNNAGFNILRSEKRDGEFTKVHFEAGQGTTSERTAYEWSDKSAKPNVVYYYQIQDVSLDGDVTTLRTTHLRGNVTAVGKVTTTWGEIKALQ